MSRTLNVGDMVRIAKDLHVSADDYEIYVNNSMARYANRIATITDIDSRNTYTLRFEGETHSSPWAWKSNMFEPTWLEVGMLVQIKDGTHKLYKYTSDEEVDTEVGVSYFDEMDEYANSVGIIEEIDSSDHSCVISTNHWWWDEHWIEPILDNYSNDKPTLTVDDSVPFVESTPTVAIRFYNILKGEKTEIHGATILDTLNFKKWVFKDASGNLYLINYTDIDYVLPE